MAFRIADTFTESLAKLEGKGQVLTSPSPLPQWGRFPIFTSVHLSRTGRSQFRCPLVGSRWSSGGITYFCPFPNGDDSLFP